MKHFLCKIAVDTYKLFSKCYLGSEQNPFRLLKSTKIHFLLKWKRKPKFCLVKKQLYEATLDC